MSYRIFLLAAALTCNAFAADTYDASTNLLTVPQVQIGQTLYNNVVVKLNNITVESIGSSTPVSNTVAATCTSANFSTAIYNAIAVGMTLAQVESTIGCQFVASSTQRTTYFVAYNWNDIASVVASGGSHSQTIQVYFDPTGSVVQGYGSQYKIGIGF